MLSSRYFNKKEQTLSQRLLFLSLRRFRLPAVLALCLGSHFRKIKQACSLPSRSRYAAAIIFNYRYMALFFDLFLSLSEYLMIKSNSWLNEIPAALALLGKRLFFVKPGNVFTSIT